jgi:hypothetical protein
MLINEHTKSATITRSRRTGPEEMNTRLSRWRG